MERLQLLVESSDLELEQVDLPSAPSKDSAAENVPGTMLGLRPPFTTSNQSPDVEASDLRSERRISFAEGRPKLRLVEPVHIDTIRQDEPGVSRRRADLFPEATVSLVPHPWVLGWLLLGDGSPIGDSEAQSVRAVELKVLQTPSGVDVIMAGLVLMRA